MKGRQWDAISSPLGHASNGDGCRRSLAHCQSDYTKSKNIIKSPVWLVASSVTLVYELKRHNVEREATLLYSGDNSSHEYRSHTHYSNTDMLKGMQTQKSVFRRNEKSYQSH